MSYLFHCIKCLHAVLFGRFLRNAGFVMFFFTESKVRGKEYALISRSTFAARVGRHLGVDVGAGVAGAADDAGAAVALAVARARAVPGAGRVALARHALLRALRFVVVFLLARNILVTI